MTSLTDVSIFDDPANFKFNCTMIKSIYNINNYNETTFGHMEKGVFKWKYNYSKVKIYDNLGNDFSPILEGDIYMNPDIYITLQPRDNYIITLLLQSNEAVFYYEEDLSYNYAINKTAIDYPSIFNIKLPKEYTLLEYPNDAKITRFNNSINIRRKFAKGENRILIVKFVPYVREVFLISKIISIDIYTIFPQKSDIITTVKYEFNLPKNIGIWKTNPFYSITINYPISTNIIYVESISDGVGICNEIHEPKVSFDLENAGSCYINKKEKTITIYPRHHFDNKYYGYSIEATFIHTYNIHKYTTIERIVKFIQPFRYTFFPSIVKSLSPDNWNIGSSSEELNVLLPIDFEPRLYGSALLDVRDGRPFLHFIIEGNSHQTNHEYIIMGYITSLKYKTFLILFIAFSTFSYYCILKTYTKKYPIINDNKINFIFSVLFTYNFLEIFIIEKLWSYILILFMELIYLRKIIIFNSNHEREIK